jgi:hypothetical protein
VKPPPKNNGSPNHDLHLQTWVVEILVKEGRQISKEELQHLPPEDLHVVTAYLLSLTSTPKKP